MTFFSLPVSVRIACGKQACFCRRMPTKHASDMETTQKSPLSADRQTLCGRFKVGKRFWGVWSLETIITPLSVIEEENGNSGNL